MSSADNKWNMLDKELTVDGKQITVKFDDGDAGETLTFLLIYTHPCECKGKTELELEELEFDKFINIDKLKLMMEEQYSLLWFIKKIEYTNDSCVNIECDKEKTHNYVGWITIHIDRCKSDKCDKENGCKFCWGKKEYDNKINVVE